MAKTCLVMAKKQLIFGVCVQHIFAGMGEIRQIAAIGLIIPGYK